MRVRLPYSEEKENAWNKIVDRLDYMEYCPTERWERRIYIAEIRRLCKRYGLKKRLRAAGFSKVLLDDKK